MVNVTNQKLIDDILERMDTIKEEWVLISDIDYAIIRFMFENTDTKASLEYAGLVDDTVVYIDILENGEWCAVRFLPKADPDLLDVSVVAIIDIITDTEHGQINQLSLKLDIRQKKIMKW